jgi:hypothetical protein
MTGPDLRFKIRRVATRHRNCSSKLLHGTTKAARMTETCCLFPFRLSRCQYLRCLTAHFSLIAGTLQIMLPKESALRTKVIEISAQPSPNEYRFEKKHLKIWLTFENYTYKSSFSYLSLTANLYDAGIRYVN